MATTTARHRRRKLRLYERQNGKCWWCKERMSIGHQHRPRVPIPDDLATMEHLDSRMSRSRGTAEYGEERTVLACNRCNNLRASLEMAITPKSVLREMSQWHDKKDKRRQEHGFNPKRNRMWNLSKEGTR